MKVKELGDEKKMKKSKPMLETDKNEGFGCGAAISDSEEVDKQPGNKAMPEVR